MKLIIQIPCYNEEKTLPQVINDLPKRLQGIDVIEYLVIDDGSTDHTAALAKDLGVHHVLSLGSNRGLAFAFSAGIKFALENGADIVVNTDGDNQYFGADIEKLIAPVVEKKADIVVGCRPIKEHKEFSFVKKVFQLLGSWVLRKISKTTVKDAPSGFRAFSKDACLRMFVYSKFSYTMETLIQAGNSSLRVVSADIRVNPKTRKSRLFKNIFEHMGKSAQTMFLMYILYRPGRFFFWIGSIFMLGAAVLGFRFVYLVFLTPTPQEHRTYLPSLILLAILAFWGVMAWLIGIVGELIKSIRKLNEEIIANQRKIMYK